MSEILPPEASTPQPWWEPPLAAPEHEHLIAMLERQRATFRWKADGLSLEQLRQPLPSSGLTLGGLLRHLAVCEDDVFGWRINGERPESFDAMPEGVDPEQWQFDITDAVSAEELLAFHDAAVARSRRRWAELVARGGLDLPAALEFDGLRPHARRHVCDLVEEYARHTGHADLLREAIDGRVGEDPDPAWQSSIEVRPLWGRHV